MSFNIALCVFMIWYKLVNLNLNIFNHEWNMVFTTKQREKWITGPISNMLLIMMTFCK